MLDLELKGSHVANLSIVKHIDVPLIICLDKHHVTVQTCQQLTVVTALPLSSLNNVLNIQLCWLVETQKHMVVYIGVFRHFHGAGRLIMIEERYSIQLANELD